MERLGRDSDKARMEEVLVVLQPSALVQMAVGTLGTLANEFILAWGRPAPCSRTVPFSDSSASAS